MVAYSEDGAIFEDGSEEKADAIVFCTGYDFEISFHRSMPDERIDSGMQEQETSPRSAAKK